LHSDWIKSIEERSEMGVFAVFTHSGYSGSGRFVVSFDEGLTVNKGILLLFRVSFLADPANNLSVEL